MTGPRELLDAYAAAEAIDDDYKHPTYEDVAPEAIAALRAVLDLHPSRLVEGRNSDGDEREGLWCECCDDSWPCPTVQAIAEALGAAEL